MEGGLVYAEEEEEESEDKLLLTTKAAEQFEEDIIQAEASWAEAVPPLNHT